MGDQNQKTTYDVTIDVSIHGFHLKFCPIILVRLQTNSTLFSKWIYLLGVKKVEKNKSSLICESIEQMIVWSDDTISEIIAKKDVKNWLKITFFNFSNQFLYDMLKYNFSPFDRK